MSAAFLPGCRLELHRRRDDAFTDLRHRMQRGGRGGRGDMYVGAELIAGLPSK